MASPGQRDSSEYGANQSGQDVLWLASSEPPAQFVSFLRSRGLLLVERSHGRAMPAARLTMIEASTSPAARPPSLAGRRLAVMHPDPGSADALAQALRAKGAEVAALSLNPESLHRVEALDPDVVIMEQADFTGSCWEIVRALWQHPRLRFATVLLATPELMGSERVSALDVHDLSFAVHRLAEDYESARTLAQKSEPLTLSLATLGPARTLRALLESGSSLRARFVSGELDVEVDIAEKIIVGAQTPDRPGQEPLLGVHALAQLMTQHSGSVQVRRVDHPAQTNVMAPLDTALHMAREVSPQRPSGLRWAPVANHNTSAPPAANKPRAAGLHNRTLIGIPAVKVDASIALDAQPARSEPAPRAGAREPKIEAAAVRKEPVLRSEPTSKPGPLARPAAPITVMPPAPRISIAPAKTARATFAREPEPTPSDSEDRAGKVASVRPSAAPPAAGNAITPSVPPPAALPRAESRASVAAPAPVKIASAPPPAFSVPAADTPLPDARVYSAPPPNLEPIGSMAEVLEPSTIAPLPELPEPSEPAEPAAPGALERIRAVVQPLHLKVAAGGLGVLLILWLGTGLLGATPAPAAQLPVARPMPAATVPAPPPAATPQAPAAAPVADNDAPALDGERPTRRASELVSQGHSFRRKRLLPTARSRYLEALREYPGYPRALAGLAQLALDTGDSAQAVQYARQLVRVRGGQAGYHVLLGDAYKAAGQAPQARAAYETAARMGSRVAKQRLK